MTGPLPTSGAPLLLATLYKLGTGTATELARASGLSLGHASRLLVVAHRSQVVTRTRIRGCAYHYRINRPLT